MIGRRLGSILASMAVASVAWVPANAVAPVLFHRPILVVGANRSSNWSGYNQGTIERNGKLFNQVSGAWRVPRATQHKAGEAEYSSTWVGIGGGCVSADCSVTDTTLIQAGTEQDVNAAGRASYSAWYELIPAPSITISGMKVRAGDAMTVAIAESPPGSNVWTISVKNATTGQSFSLTVPYSSTHLTAEWIVETPVVIDSHGNVSIGPLPSLSRVRIDNGTTNGASAGLKASEEIQLVDPGSRQVLVTPSAPDSDANGFNDCTYATSCPAPRGT